MRSVIPSPLNLTMCHGCVLTPEAAATIRALNCSGCRFLRKLPDLPQCIHLNCIDCSHLEEIGALPICEIIYAAKCPRLRMLPALPLVRRLICTEANRLTSLPELPVCVELSCNKCALLTHIPPLPECLYLQCGECPLLEYLPDLPLCLTLKCPRSRLLREIPPLAERCHELDVTSCNNLMLIPNPVPVLFQAKGTFCEPFTRSEEKSFGRPYRLRLRPFWNHWVKYARRKRNLRVLAPLVPRYPGLQDVLGKIVG